MSNIDLGYSNYIIYVDESGDHSLESINSRYPLFVLSFCIFQKEYYAHSVAPALRMLKFSTFRLGRPLPHQLADATQAPHRVPDIAT